MKRGAIPWVQYNKMTLDEIIAHDPDGCENLPAGMVPVCYRKQAMKYV